MATSNDNELYAQAISETETSVTVDTGTSISQLNSVQEIQSFIGNQFIQNEKVIELYSLDTAKSYEDQFSTASFESIIFYTIAYIIYVVKQLFALHKTEVDTKISEGKAHSKRWWRNLALAYRHGYALLQDSDQYPDEAINDESAAIVTYCEVSKGVGELVIKLAKGGDTLEAMNPDEYAGISEYLFITGDIGVNLNIISQDADHLKISVDAYFDPMVLDAEGKRLDGTNDTPLLDAITIYLQNLAVYNFDGYFTLTGLTDAMQKVEGIHNPRVLGAQTKWGAYDWEDVVNRYRAQAGWLKIYDLENDLSVVYHANISD